MNMDKQVKSDLFEVINNLIYELNLAIDEINTMRDIHHGDNLTPADHWDKEGLHIAQIAIKELNTDKGEVMSEINKIIKTMFSTRWCGSLSSGSIEEMRRELRKNLQNQLDGFWTGHTAYHIMLDGGFLVDSKRIPLHPSSSMCKGKELTALGKIFMKSWSK